MHAPYYGIFPQGEYTCELQNGEIRLWLKQGDDLYELKSGFEDLPEEIKRQVENLQELYEYICRESSHLKLHEGRFFLTVLVGLRRRVRQIEMKIERIETPLLCFLRASNQRHQKKLEEVFSQIRSIESQNKRLQERVFELEKQNKQAQLKLNMDVSFLQERRLKNQGMVDKLDRQLRALTAIHTTTERQNLQLRRRIREYDNQFEILSYRLSEGTNRDEFERPEIKRSQQTEHSETQLNLSQIVQAPESKIFQDDEENKEDKIVTVQQINQKCIQQMEKNENKRHAFQRSNKLNRIDSRSSQQRPHSEPHSLIFFQLKKKDSGQNMLSIQINKLSPQLQERYKQNGLIGPLKTGENITVFSQPIFTNLDPPVMKLKVIQSSLNHLFVGLTSNSFDKAEGIWINMQGVITVGSKATEHSFKNKVKKEKQEKIDSIELKPNFHEWNCSFLLNNRLIETVLIPQNLRKPVIHLYATLYQNTIIQI